MIRIRFFLAQGFLALLPALLVMLIAREAPDAAADFAIVLGVVGAVFSISYFGQRAYISIRGVTAIPGRAAITFRLALSLLAAGATLGIVQAMQLGLPLALFAVALKLSEGAVDVWVGLRIHTSSEAQSSKLFAAVAVVRALLVVIPVVVIGASASVENAGLLVYLAVLAAISYLLVHHDTRRMGIGGSYRVRPANLAAHGWEMRSFVAATAVCALLSTTPRLVLPYSDPGAYRSAALSLSIVPVYGLACQAIWLSNVKGMAAEFGRHARRFLLEMSLVTALVALCWPAWRFLAAHAYGLESPIDQRGFCTTLLIGVVFSGTIGLSNLFKLTRCPRNESFNYALGIGSIAFCVFVLGASVNQALFVASVAMMLYVAAFFAVLPARFARLQRQRG